MPTFEQDIQHIRQSLYGKDVREAIADGLLKVYDEAQGVSSVEALSYRSDAIGQKEPGMMSLAQLGTFENGTYYYPTWNNTVKYVVATSYPVIAPRNLYIRIKNGYKANAYLISSASSASSTGWQTDAIYIPKDTKFVINIEKVSHTPEYVANIVEHVNALRVFDDDANPWYDALASKIADSFGTGINISYSNGEFTSGVGGYWQVWYFKNPKFKRIKVHASVYGRNIGEIAFYNTTVAATTSYMGTGVSAAAGSWDENHWVYADVPDGCQLVCVCSRSLLNDNTPFTTEIFVDDAISYSESGDIVKHDGLNALKNEHLIYHYFANGGTEIPQNSLEDLDLANRLGFKYYEINAHPTATSGVHVCLHGASGKIGSYLVSKTGEDISNLDIDHVTENTFKTKYVYNSTNPKYATRVTFLKEMLAACKKYGIIPVVGMTNFDYAAIEICHDICGDNFILGCYNTWYLQRERFKGCYSYYGSLTAQELTNVIKKVGAPFLYSITNEQARDLTDDQLKELMKICHDNGCLIGYAAIYQTPAQNMKLINMGYDFSAVGWDTPTYDVGNIASLRDNDNFAMFNITGGTVQNGVLTLYNDQSFNSDIGETKYIKDGSWNFGLQGDSIIVSSTGSSGEIVSFGIPRSSKGQLRIRFNGKLKFTLGSHINNYQITSDGAQEIILSSYFHKIMPNFTAVSNGTTTVYNCSFDASAV